VHGGRKILYRQKLIVNCVNTQAKIFQKVYAEDRLRNCSKYKCVRVVNFIKTNFYTFFAPSGDFSAVCRHQLESSWLLLRVVGQDAAGRARVHQELVARDAVGEVEEGAADGHDD